MSVGFVTVCQQVSGSIYYWFSYDLNLLKNWLPAPLAREFSLEGRNSAYMTDSPKVCVCRRKFLVFICLEKFLGLGERC